MKLCIHQNAWVANHTDTLDSNDQVKKFLMSCSYWVSWKLQHTPSFTFVMCTYSFLGFFVCLFRKILLYLNSFLQIIILSKSADNSRRNRATQNLTTSSNPRSSSGMHQCQCLCLYLAPASSSERKHSESHTYVPHSLNLPLIHFTPPKERKRNRYTGIW